MREKSNGDGQLMNRHIFYLVIILCWFLAACSKTAARSVQTGRTLACKTKYIMCLQPGDSHPEGGLQQI